MSSPNFAFSDSAPNTNGFTAVNDRYSPSSVPRSVESPNRPSWQASAIHPVDKDQHSSEIIQDQHMENTSNSNGYPPPNGDQQAPNGAPREAYMDENRMAQMLQAETTRPEDGQKSDNATLANVAAGAVANANSEMVTTKAGLQFDQKKRKRAFTNRTKTGCTTCRRRKKKCDEAKPQCNNCLRGGFSCGGYTIRPDVNNSRTALNRPYPTVVPGPRDAQWDPAMGQRALPYNGMPIEGHHQIPENNSQTTNGQWSGRPPSNGYSRPMENSRSLPPPPHLNSSYPGTSSSQRGSLPFTTSANSQPYAPMHMAATALNHTRPPPPTPPPASHNSENIVEYIQAGNTYKPTDTMLVELRRRAELACNKFNSFSFQGIGGEEANRALRDIIDYDYQKPDSPPNLGSPSLRMGSDIKITAPFYAEYGFNLLIGDNVWIKGSCRFEDVREIRIGNNTTIGPNCVISGELHFTAPTWRQYRRGVIIKIGRDVTIGANVVISPEDGTLHGNPKDVNEIVIGDYAVIAPGSFVSRNVPVKGHVGSEMRFLEAPPPHRS